MLNDRVVFPHDKEKLFFFESAVPLQLKYKQKIDREEEQCFYSFKL
jgi:hypothetical protein